MNINLVIKNKVSCSHALFSFKKTIIKHLEDKKVIYAVTLDAVKAFDKIWREGLYFKMKLKKINTSVIILTKIYYDVLYSLVKINSKLSRKFKLSRGVKQGGVISGSLFNFFIDNLINLCIPSGFGATFYDIIMCIFCFCDDIGLLSDPTELQELVLICEKYANEWD